MGFTHSEATQASAIESTVDQASEWILAYRVSQTGFDDSSSGDFGSDGPPGLMAAAGTTTTIDPLVADTSEELASLCERLQTFYALVPQGGAVTGLDAGKIALIAVEVQ